MIISRLAARQNKELYTEEAVTEDSSAHDRTKHLFHFDFLQHVSLRHALGQLHKQSAPAAPPTVSRKTDDSAENNLLFHSTKPGLHNTVKVITRRGILPPRAPIAPRNVSFWRDMAKRARLHLRPMLARRSCYVPTSSSPSPTVIVLIRGSATQDGRASATPRPVLGGACNSSSATSSDL